MNPERPRHLPLYLSAGSPCGYLESRQSRNLFVDPDVAMNTVLYGQLLRRGFRRSGRLVYRPHCDHCRQCLSVRVPVQGFELKRRFRRVIEANRDLSVTPRPAAFMSEHYDLYRRYTAARHAEGSMQDSSPAEYADFLMADWCDTHFVEIRREQQLLAVAVTDQLEDGLSAVYTFFAPEEAARSLGTFAILTQIQLARQWDLPHLYLGYWVRDCRKMSYKADFRPLQLFSEGEWREVAPGEQLRVTELQDEDAP